MGRKAVFSEVCAMLGGMAVTFVKYIPLEAMMRRVRLGLSSSRRRVVMSVMLVIVVVVVVFRRFESHHVTVDTIDDFKPRTIQSEAHSTRHLRYFKRVDYQETYLYSAIANHREPKYGDLNIIITAFDSTSTDSLTCCVLTKDGKLVKTQSSLFYYFYNEPSFIGPYIQWSYSGVYTEAKQYACVLPDIGYDATHVTMTTFPSCPDFKQDYLPIVYPKTMPGGLAICGKTAFGDALDPIKLVEWFEVQRLLGVDHIQIMDLNNPEPVQRVFKYYSDMGLLNALPLELPGEPHGRGLDVKTFIPEQGDHDKSFSILECNQRLKGYTYVLGIDMDEVLMPAQNVDIKQFARRKFLEYPDAAGFYFYTEFFLYNWGPTSNTSDLFLLRYLNSTKPRNECKKYIYLTQRTIDARTHQFYPRSSFSEYWVPAEEAVLHHYRQCPHVWKTCNPPRITDSSVLRFRDLLQSRVKVARQVTGISHG